MHLGDTGRAQFLVVRRDARRERDAGAAWTFLRARLRVTARNRTKAQKKEEKQFLKEKLLIHRHDTAYFN